MGLTVLGNVYRLTGAADLAGRTFTGVIAGDWAAAFGWARRAADGRWHHLYTSNGLLSHAAVVTALAHGGDLAERRAIAAELASLGETG